MATTKRWSEGWSLGCGIWPPFLMPEPAEVSAALREQGLLPPAQAGLDVLREAWVAAQSWTYAAEFEVDDEDERCFVRFEHLSGRGEVRVNGRFCARFEPGEHMAEVTGLIADGRNLLEITFEPSLPDGAPRGITGPVWLRTTSFASLRSVRAKAVGGVITMRSELTAHVAGRFQFKYTVSLDGDALLETAVYERLRAADAVVEHELALASCTPWDPERCYMVRLSLERAGVGCDMLRVHCAMDAKAPGRRAQLPAFTARSQQALSALSELGAQAVALEGAGADGGLTAPDLLPFGLLTCDAQDGPDDQDFLALANIQTLKRLAGGERFWPHDAPVWRATRSPAPDAGAAEGFYGANALGDAARYAQISRTVQAEAVRSRAVQARILQRPFTVRPFEPAPAYASTALVEFSGQKRPAFEALKQAWRTNCALIETPETLKAPAPLSVWFLSDDKEHRPLTVTVTVYAQNGALIASTSFAALSGANARLGEVAATLPREGLLIARTEISGGENPCRIDQLLCLPGAGEPTRAALLNPQRAALRIADGALINEGGAAALGVFFDGFYGALLPGEKVALPGGIGAQDIECLSGGPQRGAC